MLKNQNSQEWINVEDEVTLFDDVVHLLLSHHKLTDMIDLACRLAG